jgi:carbonic anhydrase
MKQSPISLMSVNPAYEPQNRPLHLDYPATVENLRISNTGFSWEVKIPYQVSLTTALYAANLHRYRLDQFHCHWGDSDQQGSEHTIDGKYYSAEMHFVHYNLEKYHTLNKAARHPDGLVVLAVFLDAQPDHHNHAELDKIVANLKAIPLKGDHSIIKQAVRIDNLLPANRSYWSYQGSLTTPPYLESVTWFVLKHPIKCSTSQIERFRTLKSNLRPNDDEQVFIKSNFRKTQPLNGRTVITYDEPNGLASRLSQHSNSLSGAVRQSSPKPRY